MSLQGEKKKKPETKYFTLHDGNMVVASVEDTVFISWRTQTQSRKKGALGLGSIFPFLGKVEGETERRDEWTGVVWEKSVGVMPRSVWDEKRRREILENMRDTISIATGSNRNDVTISGYAGTITPSLQTKQCPYCNSNISTYFQFCPFCGKSLSVES